MVEIAIFNIYDVQRALTPKVGYAELWFLLSARRLMVLYIYIRFYKNISQTVFNLYGSNGYVQHSKGNNSKSRQPRVTFMCFACRLIVLYIFMKFREIITNGVRLIGRTPVHGRIGYVQCSKGNDSNSRQTRVMVHVFCTFSDSV